jgi:hypothetical protein
VTLAIDKVNKALVKVEPGLVNVPAISETASTTNIVEMSTEKISSVNLVKYLTRFEAEVTDDKNRIADVHKPVHAYSGKKGSFIAFPSWARQATKANTGPVDPMIVNGCPEKMA